MNPTSIKNKFYKRPPEIADAISDMNAQREDLETNVPTLDDLLLTEKKLQHDLNDVKHKIAERRSQLDDSKGISTRVSGV